MRHELVSFQSPDHTPTDGTQTATETPFQERPKSTHSAVDLARRDRAGGSDSELMVIHEAAKLIGHSSAPEYAIQGILRVISQMLGLNRGRVILPSSSEQLRTTYSYGLTEEERLKGVYEMGEGISGKVMKTGQLVVVQNVDEEPEFLFRAVKRSTLPPEIVSFIAVPILDGNNPIGVLACHRIRNRLRSLDSDLIILRTIATFIGQILKINSLIRQRTEHLIEENRELKDALKDKQTNHGILGESRAIRAVLQHTKQVADASVTVLLTGESGTGKERFSRILHLWSARKDKAFLAINCAAIPEQLLESELFGHEKGAFTGATSAKMGKIELANHGTLFLDEIGDLSLELQSKLLRVLESQSIQRVGGVKDIPVDVRIVAATHKNLMSSVNSGEFRLDLFYRLNVFPIHLPPLRERDDDVQILARHFLMQANEEYDRHTTLAKGVMERLKSYAWPGNIRQLENVIKRAVLMSLNGNIGIDVIESILSQESAVNHLQSHGPSHPEPSHYPSPNYGHPPQGSPYGSTNGLPNGLPNGSPNSLTHGTPHGLPPSSSQPGSVYPLGDIGTGATTPAHSDWNTSKLLEPVFPGDSVSARPYSWVSEDESEVILEALKLHRGNKTRAAASIGMTTRQLRYRMQKLGL